MSHLVLLSIGDIRHGSHEGTRSLMQNEHRGASIGDGCRLRGES